MDIKDIKKSNILSVDVAVIDIDKAVSFIKSYYDIYKGRYICFSNVHTVVMAYEDDSYRRVQNNALIVLPDGKPLSVIQKKMGYMGANKVSGPDVMDILLQDKGMYRHYFLGSTEETLCMLKEKLLKTNPSIQIVGMCSPPFRDLTKEEDDTIVRNINKVKPDFLWVGLGAPKQEMWMYEHTDKINSLMLGVGAAFDFQAGTVKRAPKWMQKSGLEWLYRLFMDPRRLFKRYFTTNTKFILYIIKNYRRLKR